MATSSVILSLLVRYFLQAVLTASLQVKATTIEDCCSFRILQGGCSDTFSVGDGGGALACTLRKYTSQQDENCLGLINAEGKTADKGSPSLQIELLSADPAPDIPCHSPGDPVDSRCADFHSSTFIALKITFMITGGGGNSSGVLFHLNTTRDNCHYLVFDDPASSTNLIINRTFSYTSFVGLHPGGTYHLQASMLTVDGSGAQASMLTVDGSAVGNSELVFNVADCNTLSSWEDDYYCSLPSPAKWSPMILVQPLSLNVTFTIWPQVSSAFTHYFLYLFLGDRLEAKFKVAREKFSTDQPGIIKNVTVGNKHHLVINYDFGVDMPGQYTVAVLPRPDDACKGDIHWGSKICLYSKKTVQYTISTSWPKKPPSNVMTENSVIPSPTDSAESPLDVTWLYVGITVTLVTVVILCMLSCSVDRGLGRHAAQCCYKMCFCGGVAASDIIEVETVTSKWHGNDYQPVLLHRPPLPGEEICTYTLDDVMYEGATTPTTCSETTSDSMSEVLPPSEKSKKHARGKKHGIQNGKHC